MGGPAKISSHGIVELLAHRHKEDVFVPECKSGSSWLNPELLILDAWAMNRSWAHPNVTGYEIKVDRADYINDKKATGYLAYCNSFYWVCPKDLISVGEVGEGEGLYYVINNRLVVKKKAPYRNVSIPESIFRYILMCRAKICRSYENHNGSESSKRAYWQAWLADQKIDSHFGLIVSKKIREVVHNKVLDVEERLEVMQRQVENYQNIREFLASLGLNPDRSSRYAVENALEGLADKRKVPDSLKSSLKELKRTMDRLVAYYAGDNNVEG